MMMKMLIVAGAVAIALGTTVAFAGFGGTEEGIAPGGCVPQGGMRDGRAGGILERLDTDGDGQVSRAEYEASFDRLDKNGDGYVTREEVSQLRDEKRTERRDEMMNRDDTDGDGMVSRDEFSGPSKIFVKVDADNDGYITREEAMEFQPMRDGSCRPDGGHRGPGGRRGPAGSF